MQDASKSFYLDPGSCILDLDMTYTLSDFDFQLPKELIASFPPKDRAGSRLLSVDRKAGSISHHTFRDIVDFLKPGDLLVLNNTKVLPARLFGKKETGGRVEALLLKEKGSNQWNALLRPGGRIRKGAAVIFGENGIRLRAQVLDEAKSNTGERLIEFHVGVYGHTPLRETLQKIGRIPLPPYLDRPDTPLDREMYQTVFAEREGAVASPTAGLHFDQALLDDLQKKGVEIAFVTLHVSYGTFQPIVAEDLSQHEMFEEEFEVSKEAAAAVNKALAENRRVIACGTTSVRCLESAVETGDRYAVRNSYLSPVSVKAQRGITKLFIYPPYHFKVVSGLITNFHLPKSTLLLLAAAFLQKYKTPTSNVGQVLTCPPVAASGHVETCPTLEIPCLNGRDLLFRTYEEAIRNRYRFYSYGDAMIIL